MNKVLLTGRICNELQIAKTNTGLSVLNFCVATDEGKNKSGERKSTFIDCTAWKGTAEFLEKYAHKGDLVEVVGSIMVNSFKNKEGYNTKQTKINCENVKVLSSKKHYDGDYKPASEAETSIVDTLADEDYEISPDTLPF